MSPAWRRCAARPHRRGADRHRRADARRRPAAGRPAPGRRAPGARWPSTSMPRPCAAARWTRWSPSTRCAPSWWPMARGCCSPAPTCRGLIVDVLAGACPRSQRCPGRPPACPWWPACCRPARPGSRTAASAPPRWRRGCALPPAAVQAAFGQLQLPDLAANRQWLAGQPPQLLVTARRLETVMQRAPPCCRPPPPAWPTRALRRRWPTRANLPAS